MNRFIGINLQKCINYNDYRKGRPLVQCHLDNKKFEVISNSYKSETMKYFILPSVWLILPVKFRFKNITNVLLNLTSVDDDRQKGGSCMDPPRPFTPRIMSSKKDHERIGSCDMKNISANI